MLLSSKMHYDKDNEHVKRVWGQGPPVIFVHSWAIVPRSGDYWRCKVPSWVFVPLHLIVPGTAILPNGVRVKPLKITV